MAITIVPGKSSFDVTLPDGTAGQFYARPPSAPANLSRGTFVERVVAALKRLGATIEEKPVAEKQPKAAKKAKTEKKSETKTPARKQGKPVPKPGAKKSKTPLKVKPMSAAAASILPAELRPKSEEKKNGNGHKNGNGKTAAA